MQRFHIEDEFLAHLITMEEEGNHTHGKDVNPPNHIDSASIDDVLAYLKGNPPCVNPHEAVSNMETAMSNDAYHSYVQRIEHNGCPKTTMKAVLNAISNIFGKTQCKFTRNQVDDREQRNTHGKYYLPCFMCSDSFQIYRACIVSIHDTGTVLVMSIDDKINEVLFDGIVYEFSSPKWCHDVNQVYANIKHASKANAVSYLRTRPQLWAPEDGVRFMLNKLKEDPGKNVALAISSCETRRRSQAAIRDASDNGVAKWSGRQTMSFRRGGKLYGASLVVIGDEGVLFIRLVPPRRSSKLFKKAKTSQNDKPKGTKRKLLETCE